MNAVLQAKPLVFALSLCTFVVGCGGSSSTLLSVWKEIASVTKETADLLATVKDKSSAQSAAPKLLASIDRKKKLFRQADSMNSVSMTFEAVSDLSGEMASRMESYSLLKEELERIEKIPEACEGLGEAWQKLSAGEMDWDTDKAPQNNGDYQF